MPIASVLISFWLLFASHYSGLSIPVNAAPIVLETTTFEGYVLGEELAGMTSRYDGTVALMVGYEPCVLAHELTHYLQFKNIGFTTAKANEPMAYRVMAECYKYLHKPTAAIWALNRASYFSHLD